MLFSQDAEYARKVLEAMFQSPKTGLCFSHGGPVFSTLLGVLMFQSPKTGLCFSHIVGALNVQRTISCFNPLKRVYAFLTWRLFLVCGGGGRNVSIP